MIRVEHRAEISFHPQPGVLGLDLAQARSLVAGQTLALAPVDAVLLQSGSRGGVTPPGSHRTVRDSLPSHGSGHRFQENMLVTCQWANRSGCRSTSPYHHR